MPWRAAAPLSLLFVVPNLIAHPSTASVPTLYYSMRHFRKALCSNTVIGTLAFDGWVVTFDTARMGLDRLRPWCSLFVVPNVTAHTSTASVPTSYYSMWHYNYLHTVNG